MGPFHDWRTLANVLLLGAAIGAVPIDDARPLPHELTLMQNNGEPHGALGSRGSNLRVAQAGAEKRETLASTAGGATPIRLGADAVHVTLRPASAGASLASRIDALPAGRKLYLLLNGLAAPAQPGARYHVYLGLPSEAKPSPDDPHYVGTFTFFGVAGRATRPADPSSAAYSIDVADAVKRLRARKLLDDGVRVTIVPSGAPAKGVKPTIASIALVAE